MILWDTIITSTMKWVPYRGRPLRHLRKQCTRGRHAWKGHLYIWGGTKENRSRSPWCGPLYIDESTKKSRASYICRGNPNLRDDMERCRFWITMIEDQKDPIDGVWKVWWCVNLACKLSSDSVNLSFDDIASTFSPMNLKALIHHSVF